MSDKGNRIQSLSIDILPGIRFLRARFGRTAVEYVVEIQCWRNQEGDAAVAQRLVLYSQQQGEQSRHINICCGLRTLKLHANCLCFPLHIDRFCTEI